MVDAKPTRRDFVKAATAAAVSTSMISTARSDPLIATKILNHNPAMNYRRLGKTEFMISEIALGGHGAHGYDEQAVQNRIPVLERAIELGMNYVDTNIGRECDVYGEAMARSATARRDKWFIGFASSEDHRIDKLEDQLTPARLMRSIEDRLRSYKTDMLDMWRPVAATWGQDEPNLDKRLAITRRMFDMVVQVFEKAKRQGKVWFLGTPEHEPKIFYQVLLSGYKDGGHFGRQQTVAQTCLHCHMHWDWKTGVFSLNSIFCFAPNGGMPGIVIPMGYGEIQPHPQPQRIARWKQRQEDYVRLVEYARAAEQGADRR